MTIQDLIDKLKKLNPETEVGLDEGPGYCGGDCIYVSTPDRNDEYGVAWLRGKYTNREGTHD